MPHFDWTISFGNLLTLVVFVFAAIKFWGAQVETKKDLEWRISNLETWRREHTIDSDARDQLQKDTGTILKRLEWVEEARQKQLNAPLGKRRLGEE